MTLQITPEDLRRVREILNQMKELSSRGEKLNERYRQIEWEKQMLIRERGPVYGTYDDEP